MYGGPAVVTEEEADFRIAVEVFVEYMRSLIDCFGRERYQWPDEAKVTVEYEDGWADTSPLVAETVAIVRWVLAREALINLRIHSHSGAINQWGIGQDDGPFCLGNVISGYPLFATFFQKRMRKVAARLQEKLRFKYDVTAVNDGTGVVIDVSIGTVLSEFEEHVKKAKKPEKKDTKQLRKQQFQASQRFKGGSPRR